MIKNRYFFLTLLVEDWVTGCKCSDNCIGYDPSTKLVRDFGDNKYEPCEIIKLSNPVVDEANNPQKAGETSDYAEESNVTAKENDVEESADVNPYKRGGKPDSE